MRSRVGQTPYIGTSEDLSIIRFKDICRQVLIDISDFYKNNSNLNLPTHSGILDTEKLIRFKSLIKYDDELLALESFLRSNSLAIQPTNTISPIQTATLSTLDRTRFILVPKTKENENFKITPYLQNSLKAQDELILDIYSQ